MEENKTSQDKKIDPPNLKGEVVEKKRGRIRNAFISEDITDVKDYVFMDVFIPAIKKLVVDVFVNGLNALFYGNSAPRNGGSRISIMTPYDKISQGNSTVVKPYQARASYEVANIIFKNEDDARMVLDTLCEIFDRYRYVSVADLYQQIKRNPTAIDFDWGWKDIRSVHVMFNRNGWVLDLPKPVYLKK